MANLPAAIIMSPVANYTEFKGSLAENTVLECMRPLLDSDDPYYWTSDGRAEVEFVLQWESYIIPVEVKAEDNISGKSLALYSKKYEPEYRVRFSMLNLQYNGGLISSPTPLAAWFDRLMALLPASTPLVR